MKSMIRKLIPFFLIDYYKRFRRLIEHERNKKIGVEEVFTDIYTNNKWGGQKGQFCSGGGSSEKAIVSAYVAMIQAKAQTEGFQGLKFVDLGCGDFHVGKQLLPLCSQYIGIDIVKPLIARNQEEFGNESTRFMQLNIVEDNLPQGDVCFIRQVLQHLSNQQIISVLSKLKAYKWVFITEHYPTDNNSIKPNKDKVHGGDIRVYENSGVYLSEPPFGLPKQSLQIVLEVLGSDTGSGNDRGVIRTFLYKPNLDMGEHANG